MNTQRRNHRLALLMAALGCLWVGICTTAATAYYAVLQWQ